jgi:hypothetical protein
MATDNTILAAQSMASSFNSDPIYIGHLEVCAIQAVFTGSPVGSFKLQSSLDGVTYTDITGSTAAVSAAGDIMWNVDAAGFQRLRVAYTATSGSGSCTIKINLKGF